MNRLMNIVLVLFSVLVIASCGGGTTSETETTDLYFLHNNHLATAQVVTDEAGDTVWEGHYSPFGEVEVVVEDVAFGGRFPGQYFDQESGLYYNYFRDYDPGIGRYVQSDPIGLWGGMNTYAYVNGNPTVYSDPLGLAVRDPNSQYCKSLARRISNLEKELEKRYTEYESDPLNLPERIGPGEALAETRRGHITKINETDSRLRKNIEKYYNECGSPPPPAPSGFPQDSGDSSLQCNENCEGSWVTTFVVGVGMVLTYVFTCVAF
jgi:RHS repeat-associated protein